MLLEEVSPQEQGQLSRDHADWVLESKSANHNRQFDLADRGLGLPISKPERVLGGF